MATTEPLRVRTAATVICIRRGTCPTPPLTREEATGAESAREGAGGEGPARLDLVFGTSDSTVFSGGWETLMGQSEVQNWVRSTAEKAEAMRYPGEWKFAGGAVEPGERPVDAAKRELQEEFRIELPEDPSACKLHLLSVKQTRPIRNVSFIMYNFVAAVEENEWLENLDVERTNFALAERREKHREVVNDGTFWSLEKLAREQVSPEVRQVQWLDMREAILHQFTSMNYSYVPVNSFQEQEFVRLGIARRDPMFLTMATLLEAESFPSVGSLARYSSEMCPEQELRCVQWLFDGMSPEEAAEAWQASSNPTEKRREGMFRTAEQRSDLRKARTKEDARLAEIAKAARL